MSHEARKILTLLLFEANTNQLGLLWTTGEEARERRGIWLHVEREVARALAAEEEE